MLAADNLASRVLGRWSSPQVLLQLYAATDHDRLCAAAHEAADALGGP